MIQGKEDLGDGAELVYLRSKIHVSLPITLQSGHDGRISCPLASNLQIQNCACHFRLLDQLRRPKSW